MAYSSAAAGALNAAVKTSPAWVSLCTSTAPLVSTAVFLSPAPTIAKVMSNRSVGSLPLLPYSSMVVNAFVWVLYGILKAESKIWAPNSFGLFMGSIYFFQFRRFCSKKSTSLPGTPSQHVNYSALIMTFAALVATMMQRSLATDLIGKLGVFLCVILFASPLAALKTVVQTKSARSIPLPFTLACMLNCFLWSVAGIFEMKDFNVYFPNVLGLMSAVAQLVLKLMYGDGNNSGRVGGELLPM